MFNKTVSTALVASFMASTALTAPAFADSYSFRHDNIQQINAMNIDESPNRVNIVKELERRIAKTGKTSGVHGDYVWVKIGDRFYSHSLRDLRLHSNPSEKFQEIVSAQVAEDRIADLDVAIADAQGALIEAIASLTEDGNSKNLFEIGKLRLDYLKTQQAFLAGELGLEGFEPTSLDTLTEHERAYFEALNGFVQDYVSNVEVTDVTLSDAGRVTVTLSNGQELYIEDFANSYNQGHIDARDSLSHSVDVEGDMVTYTMTMHDGSIHTVNVDVNSIRLDAEHDVWDTRVTSVDVANKRATITLTADDGEVFTQNIDVTSVYNSVTQSSVNSVDADADTVTYTVTLSNGVTQTVVVDASAIELAGFNRAGFDSVVRSVDIAGKTASVAVTLDNGKTATYTVDVTSVYNSVRATAARTSGTNTVVVTLDNGNNINFDAQQIFNDGVASVTLSAAAQVRNGDVYSVVVSTSAGNTATQTVTIDASEIRNEGVNSVTVNTLTASVSGQNVVINAGASNGATRTLTFDASAIFMAGQSNGAPTSATIDAATGEITVTNAAGASFTFSSTVVTGSLDSGLSISNAGVVSGQVTLSNGQTVDITGTLANSYDAGVDAGEQAVVDAIEAGVVEITRTDLTEANIVAAVNAAIDGVGYTSAGTTITHTPGSVGWAAGDYVSYTTTSDGLTLTTYSVVGADGTFTQTGLTTEPTTGTNLGELDRPIAQLLASLGTPEARTIAVTLTSGTVINVDVQAVYAAGVTAGNAAGRAAVVSALNEVDGINLSGTPTDMQIEAAVEAALTAAGNDQRTAITAELNGIDGISGLSAASTDAQIAAAVRGAITAAEGAVDVSHRVTFNGGPATVTVTDNTDVTVTISGGQVTINGGLVGSYTTEADAQQALVNTIVNGVAELTGPLTTANIVARINAAIDGVAKRSQTTVAREVSYAAGDYYTFDFMGGTYYSILNADGTVANPGAFLTTAPSTGTLLGDAGTMAHADFLAGLPVTGRTLEVTLTNGAVISVDVAGVYTAGFNAGVASVDAFDATTDIERSAVELSVTGTGNTRTIGNNANGNTVVINLNDGLSITETMTKVFRISVDQVHADISAATGGRITANGDGYDATVFTTTNENTAYVGSTAASVVSGAVSLGMTDLTSIMPADAARMINEAIDAAYGNGYNDGYDAGYADGYADGFADGRATND